MLALDGTICLTPVTAYAILEYCYHVMTRCSDSITMKTTFRDINGRTRAYWGSYGYAVLTPTGELALCANAGTLAEHQEAELLSLACQHWGMAYLFAKEERYDDYL